MEKTHGQRFSRLTFEQVKKLDALMDEVMPIHGRRNFPTLEIKLKDLVQVVRAKLEKDSLQVRDIRLIGGAASHVLAPDIRPYNDLDLFFAVDLSSQKCFERVNNAVLDSLLEFLPEDLKKGNISSLVMKEAYVHMMVKVEDLDRWTLISLNNNRGRYVEFKFVDKMKRQFEFSVDSFQIILDSLLQFYGCAEMPMTDTFYPTVTGESVYGDFTEAWYHLHKKFIATWYPEQIPGRGLLKYCNLLFRNYKPAKPDEVKTLERYMCSRFFIDFTDLNKQRKKLEGYLMNRFVGCEQCKFDYLMILYRVVDESSICLMDHERRQTLCMIENMAYQLYMLEQQTLFLVKHRDLSNSVSNQSQFYVNNGFIYSPYMATTTYSP